MACSAPEGEPWLHSPQAIEMINLWLSQAHMDESSEGHLSCMRCGTFCERETMRMQRRLAITHDGGVLHPRQPTIHWLTCKNCANINIDQAATQIRRHFQDIDRSENKIDSLDEKSNSWNTGFKNSKTNGWMSLIACITLKRIMNSLSCNSRSPLSMRHGRVCLVPCGCTSLVDPAFRRLTKNNH